MMFELLTAEGCYFMYRDDQQVQYGNDRNFFLDFDKGFISVNATICIVDVQNNTLFYLEFDT